MSCDELLTHSIQENVNVEPIKTTKYRGVGITCCVPSCYNNSIKNDNLSFYVIPKQSNFRKRWLSLISRKNFAPSISHRDCSAHFTGGKKIYMNNCQSLLPKLVRCNTIKQRITLNSTVGCKRKIEAVVYKKVILTFQQKKLRLKSYKKK